MRFATMTMLLLALCASVAGAHEDVVPYSLGGKIVTGGHDDALGTDNLEQRVFGYDFGEDPSDPYFIGDPGFNNGAFAIGVYPGDGLLPGGFTLRFNVLTNLDFWDGTGAVSFAPAAAGVSLGLQRGSNTVEVSGVGSSGTVPTIGSTGLGRLHVHLSSLLNSTDGTDPLAPNAPEGIYMVGLELTLSGSGLGNSDSIYFVYNNGLSEEQHDLAIEAVTASLNVPEPATAWLGLSALGALGVVVVSRRRRA